LELYRAESQETGGIWVDLPTGTYVPVFRSRQLETAGETPVGDPVVSQEAAAGEVPRKPTDAIATVPVGSTLPPHPMSSRRVLILHETEQFIKSGLSGKTIGFSLLVLLIGGVLGYLIRVPQHPPEAVTEFWGPVLSSPKPVIISLGKPFVYAPSAHLFDEYAKNHSGAFEFGVDRHNHHLPLDGNTPLRWSDMIPVNNSGPAVGGVRAGLNLTSFLGRFSRAFIVRFGDEGSFLELRDSPSIVVGAQNNRWTTNIDGGFHFSIRDNNSYQYVVEAGTNRTWRVEHTGSGIRDYGLITREPTAITGRFLLKIAGLEDGGTEAGSELVTNPEMLQGIVRTLPPHWETKNLQILVATDVIGHNAGPPQVIAVYAW
jgi:hypothetical protein